MNKDIHGLLVSSLFYWCRGCQNFLTVVLPTLWLLKSWVWIVSQYHGLSKVPVHQSSKPEHITWRFLRIKAKTKHTEPLKVYQSSYET